MTDNDIIPFGKHKGSRLSDVPASYLLWLWDNGVWADKTHSLHSYIKDSFTVLCNECPDYIVGHQPE